MKRIIIVVDPDYSADKKAELEQLKKKIGRKAKLHFIKATNPMEVHGEIYKAVFLSEESVASSLVLYSDGAKTQTLYALPCSRLDLSLLLTNIKETVGDPENVYNKNVICTLYAGAICALIK